MVLKNENNFQPCSPWNVTSKFLHQSAVLNPLVAFILLCNSLVLETLKANFSW